jgi:hypothetical protein
MQISQGCAQCAVVDTVATVPVGTTLEVPGEKESF